MAVTRYSFSKHYRARPPLRVIGESIRSAEVASNMLHGFLSHKVPEVWLLPSSTLNSNSSWLSIPARKVAFSRQCCFSSCGFSQSSLRVTCGWRLCESDGERIGLDLLMRPSLWPFHWIKDSGRIFKVARLWIGNTWHKIL
ncbi:hypothetical protein FNV43_RR24590 [Rhamnella rubrinervis]|uniref:Uncharacterized protein n=1 Tax=Rhamnella rubrinervis TaxID=2594499 RepID=A0A8K0DSQ2_9ROSA|nr:hypothetical protein FNV43_RR24590 [Rhamnella rubrinervis]